jgi:hypothetical protein
MKTSIKPELILRVEVIKIDESGTKTICSHAEHCMDEQPLSHESELCRYAYEASDQARNKFCGIDDLPPDATQN